MINRLNIVIVLIVLLLTPILMEGKDLSSFKINTSAKAHWNTAIKQYSKRYDVKENIIYAVIAQECSFDIGVKHADILVNGKTTNAIGAGIVFEYWSKELRNIGIYKKHQLYLIDNNAKAVAYILSLLRKKKRIVGTYSLEESMLLRYYGIIRKNNILDKSYFVAINKRKNKI